MKESWVKHWVNVCMAVSEKSKDRSTKIGCVIVDERNCLLSTGWNGFPRGVNDDINERHTRPQKYKWTEHAERNAIYNAAAKGIALLGSTIIFPWFSCPDCARAIIQAGIKTVICERPNFNDPTYGEDFKYSYVMFQEAGIEIIYHSYANLNKDRKELKEV